MPLKARIKSWLQLDDLPLDRWLAARGELSPAARRRVTFRSVVQTVAAYLRSAVLLPLRLVTWPVYLLRFLAELERLHYAPFRQVNKGKGCVVDRQTWLINGRNIELGHHVKISAFSSVMAGNRSKVRIGSGTIIGPGVVVVAFNHRYWLRNRPIRYQGWDDREEESVSIGENVWIGANAVILPGAQIGDGSVVGAGAIVAGTVPNGSVFISRHPSHSRTIGDA